MRFVHRPETRTTVTITLAFLACVLAAACSGPLASEVEKNEEKTAPIATASRFWPMFGGSVQRNMANTVEKGTPDTFSIQKGKQRNIKWTVPLGTMAYGGPVIAGGKIFVGTNNEKPRDPNIKGDKGILLCLRESDGEFLWQAVHDKLPEPDVNDCRKHGVASTPIVDGNRVYYVSNRCELVCADVEGDKATKKAKVLWTFDMIKEFEVFPCYLANCSPLIIDDLVFTLTANGVDPTNHALPSPKAPSFIAVNKNTGKLAWKDNSPGEKIMEGQWANPSAAQVNGEWQVIFPGGDGWLRGFEAKTGKLLWKFDCNPKKSEYKPGGRGDRSYMIATPVVYDNKVYIGTGNDPEDGPGVGHLWCIDITKKPANKDLDLSPVGDNFDPKSPVNKDSGLLWHYGGVNPKAGDNDRKYFFDRTLSTVAIHEGLVYATDLIGILHCLDAKTGEKYWDFDLQDNTWSSPFYADGKVFIGTDSGNLFVMPHGKEFKKPQKFDLDQPLRVPPIAVNGVLYINNGYNLYAIAPK